MPAFIVSYDLMKQGQNYTCLIEKLKKYGTHWHMQQSVWIVVTDQTSAQIRDYLNPCLDANDKLFVCRLYRDGAWVGHTDAVAQWLNQHL